MPVATARPVKVLTAAERHRLQKAAYGHTTEHRARVRAWIVLLAARGRSNARIAVEASTVRRWLDQDTIKLWQHRSWIFITDLHFRPKAAHVLDLYARSWDGEPLGADEYVISADELDRAEAR